VRLGKNFKKKKKKKTLGTLGTLGFLVVERSRKKKRKLNIKAIVTSIIYYRAIQ
jgi:hypothetical protein